MYGVSRKPVRFLINPLSFVSSIKERPGRDIEGLIWIEGILGSIQEINTSPSTSRNTPTLPAHRFCCGMKSTLNGGSEGESKDCGKCSFSQVKNMSGFSVPSFLPLSPYPRLELSPRNTLCPAPADVVEVKVWAPLGATS